MENTGFYVIPNKTQYEIGERVYLEIRKTGPTKANHVKVSLFTYQGENLKMECTLEQGVYIFPALFHIPVKSVFSTPFPCEYPSTIFCQ